MHIVLDLQACQSPESSRRGIGRYSLALAKAIAAAPRGHRISVFLNGAMSESVEALRAQFTGVLAPEQIVVWSGLRQTAEIDPANHFRNGTCEVLREHALESLEPDIVHIASVFEGLADDVVCSVPQGAAYATAVTLYDLIPLVHEKTYLADPRVRRWYMNRLAHLKRADLLCGISRFSCEEARDLLGLASQGVVDISGAADDCFRQIQGAGAFRHELMRRYRLSRAFLMYAGGFDARKNVEGLIRAFANLPVALRQRHQLVIAGKAPRPERQALDDLSTALGLRSSEVVFLGYVPDVDLVKLYNLCALYVFPSLQEGFGLPALEAMRSGAVVVGSETSSLPEVIGFQEALFDPRDVEAMTSKIAMALTDEGFRSRFREHARRHCHSFSWESSARRAIEAFETVAKVVPIRRGTCDASRDSTAVDWLAAPGGGIVPHEARLYADSDCHGVDASYTLSEYSQTRSAGSDVVVLELIDDPYCARTLLLAEAFRADLVLGGPSLGGPLHALAKHPDGKRLVELLLYRSGGYHALAAAREADFSRDVLATRVTPAGLAAHGSWQVSQISGVGKIPRSLAWRTSSRPFIERIVGQEGAATAPDDEWRGIAGALANNGATAGGTRQWLVDISNLVVHDAGTGIQRVVRHVLDELMKAPPPGCRVEPVRIDDDGVLRYARDYCRHRYFPDASLPPDDPVAYASGDLFLGLDLAAHLIPQNLLLFRAMRDAGVHQYFVVYDLLPLIRPDCFDEVNLPLFRNWYESVAQVADGVLCISNAVADEFEVWLHQARPARLRPLSIGWFHLGADLLPERNRVISAAQVPEELAPLGDRPTFLMVGTIEPRKGHAQVLEAFELLWRDGVEVNLLIIGKPGWMVKELLSRLRGHRERGQRLFWFEQAGDNLLLGSYRRANALLMASEGEGFGLPLIEAASHGLPLITRDLPVFREVAGEQAFYFSGFGPMSLSSRLREWLALHANGLAPSSEGVRWKTWAQATADMVDVVEHARWSHRWLPGPRWRFAAFDYRFRTSVGRLVHGGLQSEGREGVLMLGPGITLAAGRYELRIIGNGHGDGILRVLTERGEVASVSTDAVTEHGVLAKLAFQIDEEAADWRMELWVAATADISVEAAELLQMDVGDVAA